MDDLEIKALSRHFCFNIKFMMKTLICIIKSGMLLLVFIINLKEKMSLYERVSVCMLVSPSINRNNFWGGYKILVFCTYKFSSTCVSFFFHFFLSLSYNFYVYPIFFSFYYSFSFFIVSTPHFPFLCPLFYHSLCFAYGHIT